MLHITQITLNKYFTLITIKTTSIDCLYNFVELCYNICMKKVTKYADIKKQQKIKQTKQFKDKYFEYYDDIKSHTHDVYDW